MPKNEIVSHSTEALQLNNENYDDLKSVVTAEKHKKLNEKEISELISAAKEARVRAYAPYSKFRVGSALLTEDGSVITGCNVENVSYGLTVCAEKTAICRAVTDGHRRFKAIAVVAEMKGRFVFPCGGCRQFLAEFSLDCEVYIAQPCGTYMKTTLEKLIPDSFNPEWVDFKKCT